MDLAILQFERGQVPHREVAKLPLPRIDQETLGHRAEKPPLPFFVPDPPGVIHVGGEGPARPRPRSTPIAGDHVAESVMLNRDVRASLQFHDNGVEHRLLVKRGRRLLLESPHHAEYFAALHGIRLRRIRRVRAGQIHPRGERWVWFPSRAATTPRHCRRRSRAPARQTREPQGRRTARFPPAASSPPLSSRPRAYRLFCPAPPPRLESPASDPAKKSSDKRR